jgi:hypothetical protein
MGGALVLVLVDVLPLPFFWVLMLPFYIALGPFIRWGNHRQNAIRAADLQEQKQYHE